MERDDEVCYTERYINKQSKYEISPETCDALIQAVGFWELTKKSF